MSELLVVAGLSGAGRSHLASNLDDLGWFVIDRLPAEIMGRVSELASVTDSNWNRVAFIGKADTSEGETLAAVSELRKTKETVTLLFLDCSTETLVRRYKDSRRPHPMSNISTIEEAIEAERIMMASTRAEADLILDTSELSVHDLREAASRLYGTEGDSGMQISVSSFGFKYGVPRDVDIQLDCRFLPNPHWVEELREKNGLSSDVRDYVLSQESAEPFLNDISSLLSDLIPAYENEGKSYLSVAFGCTGGKHRSVAIAEELSRILKSEEINISTFHRDIGK
ncbi:MAG: RNase adapter RapZ [Acidimicrobiales bacterium]|nr:RNase adapter RapZ [Acidimicrobiales bacterium]